MENKKVLLCIYDRHIMDMIPGNTNTLNGFEFSLDPDPEVIYDFAVCVEVLDKPVSIRVRKGCTLFIPSEPPTIRSFSTPFLNQFNYLYTHREDLIIRFKGAKSFIGDSWAFWRLGLDENLEKQNQPRHIRNYDTLKTYQPFKSLDVSMIVSNKPGTPLQRTRIKFAQVLQQYLGNSGKFHLFGRGIRDISDKAIALDNFRFSVAMENSELPYYFTEKIVDCILANTIPLYWGCTNITDYFEICKHPLFMPDPYDLQTSLQKVQYIIQNSEAIYNQYLPILLRDKDKILHEYNMISRLTQILPEIDKSYNDIFNGSLEIEDLVLQKDSVGYYN